MSLLEKFKSILSTNDFNQLAPFKEPLTWNSLSLDERELLGILFVKQGEIQLNKGDNQVLESFDIASKIAPQSPTVYYRKAIVYSSQGLNIRCLLAANEALEKATQLDPEFTSAWHAWGNVLVRIGLMNDSPQSFYQADEKFKKAEQLISQNGLRKSENLLWHWAVCWYHIGTQSGEAVDYFRSLEKFREASLAGCQSGEFHNDFGNVLIDLASLVGRKELLIEAVDHYKSFTMLSPFQHEAWLNLACTYMRLHELTGLPGYFQEARDGFHRAMELNPDNAAGWTLWADLYAKTGKATRDIDKIYTSIEKFEKAHDLDPDSVQNLLKWGEAQMQIAAYNEDLDLLRVAENKIVQALGMMSDHPDAWYVYGLCLSEFGRYFASENYYLKAIEKYQCGLSLNSSHPLLLHGMALANFSLGELRQDVLLIEEAVRYFNRLAEHRNPSIPQFYSDWGVALMKLGEMTDDKAYIESAAEKFEQAIGRRMDGIYGDEMELEWFYNYGCALDFLGDFHEEPTYYEKAVQVLSHVLKLDPDYSHAKYNLALAFYHLGELNADVDCFRKANDHFQGLIEADPEDEVTWNDYGLCILNLAVLIHDPAHPEEGNSLFEQAEAKLQQAIALGNVHAYYNLACLNAIIGHTSAAMHFLEKAEQNHSLPPVDDVINDEWLEHLHDQNTFRVFISRLISEQEGNG